MARVLFVEGGPFTGKSTLSEFIAQQFELNGHPARWVSEGTMLQEFFPHVLASFDPHVPLSEDVLWEQWRTFVEAAANASQTFVVDSALSYAAIHPLLARGRPVAEILRRLERLRDVCAPLRPRVIHLTGDAADLVPASIVERGEGWRAHLVHQAEATAYLQERGRSGVAGAIDLIQVSQAVTRQVLAAGWSSLTLDVTERAWPAYRSAALDFLGLVAVEAIPPSVPLERLRSYSGSYAPDLPPEPAKVLRVELEQDHLVLYGSDTRYDVLIPRSERRFHVRATTLDVEFEIDGGGAQRLVLLPAHDAPQTFHRIDVRAHPRRRGSPGRRA